MKIRRKNHQYTRKTFLIKNRWSFSKQVCNGSFGKEVIEPTFSKEDGDKFYPTTYSISRRLDIGKLQWYPKVNINPEQGMVPFDLSPIKPKEVLSTLKKAKQNSASGPDGIPYGILTKLPSTHHVLATLYTKVATVGSPPDTWSESIVKLIYKKEIQKTQETIE